MSAIAGIIYLDGRPIHTEMLDPVMDRLVAYGIDGVGINHLGRAIFGHQMLHTTPESEDEVLPLISQGFLITADARLDNRDELCQWLTIPHERRQSIPDSELILQAYQKWGAECPERLIGDYAFAIWNEEQRTLFCARDHIGVKPFYYYRNTFFFAFASEIAPLLALPDVPDMIDEREIIRLIYQEDVYGSVTNTFIKDVHRLPYSHYLKLTESDCKIQQYWFPEHIEPLNLPNDDEYCEQLMDVLCLAVRSRLRSNHMIGAHLSGGIDSSSIAVIASRYLRERGCSMPVYSWSTDNGVREEDDSSLQRVRMIAEREGLFPRFVNDNSWEDTLSNTDVSLREIRTLAYERQVQRLAQGDGVRILLSGWGGDETLSFNGRGHKAHQLLTGQWWGLLHNLKGPNHKLISVQAARDVPIRFAQELIQPFLPDWLKRRLAFPSHAVPSDRFVYPEVEARWQSDPLLKTANIPPFLPDAHKNQLMLFYLGHIASRMESWAWSGAEHRIVYAYPLTDRRLMTFAYSLPGDQYTQNSWNRYLFRRATASLFPPGFTWNQYGGVKQDFASTSFYARRLAQQQSKQIQEIPASDLEKLRQAKLAIWQDNPWIDVDRLRATIKTPAWKRTYPKRIAVRRAFTCLAIYEAWQLRQKA